MANQHSGDRTKAIIAVSLRKLMQKKPLDKIKIREIVDDCGVNRQTFYYHFQDIYALVEWIYERDATKLIESHKNESDWMSIVKEILHYIEENRTEIMCVLNSKAHVYFTDFVYKDLSESIKAIIDKIADDLVVDDYYKNFIASFYTLALSGVVDNWLKNNNSTRMSSSELVHMIDITIVGNIRSTLERCAAESVKKQ